MQKKRGEQKQQPRPRSNRSRASRGSAVLAGKLQRRRMHHRRRPARIEHFEFAAKRGVVGATAVGDIISAGPERAGMVVDAFEPPGPITLAQASIFQSGLTGLPSRSAVIWVATDWPAFRISRMPGPPHCAISRVECQPPILDAPIDGCSARRCKMTLVNSALRASKSGQHDGGHGRRKQPLHFHVDARHIQTSSNHLPCESRGREPPSRRPAPLHCASTHLALVRHLAFQLLMSSS